MIEAQYMPGIRDAWAKRCATFKLRPGTKGRERELEAYLQGVLAALTVTGNMTMDRAGQIAFLVMVGRGESWLAEPKEARYIVVVHPGEDGERQASSHATPEEARAASKKLSGELQCGADVKKLLPDGTLTTEF